jgi:hypothetical protein
MSISCSYLAGGPGREAGAEGTEMEVVPRREILRDLTCVGFRGESKRSLAELGL